MLRQLPTGVRECEKRYMKYSHGTIKPHHERGIGIKNILLIATKVLISLIPCLLLLVWLLKQFPHTGLGRIIAVPYIFSTNITLLIVAIMNVKNFKKINSKLVYCIVISLTLVLTISLYPQDYGPHVLVKIWDFIRDKQINNY